MHSPPNTNRNLLSATVDEMSALTAAGVKQAPETVRVVEEDTADDALLLEAAARSQIVMTFRCYVEHQAHQAHQAPGTSRD